MRISSFLGIQRLRIQYPTVPDHRLCEQCNESIIMLSDAHSHSSKPWTECPRDDSPDTAPGSSKLIHIPRSVALGERFVAITTVLRTLERSVRFACETQVVGCVFATRTKICGTLFRGRALE